MGRMARAPERNAITEIRELLAPHSPSSYCDACLARWLEISLADAKAAAVSVSGEPVFSWESRDPYACARIIEATSMSPPKLAPYCAAAIRDKIRSGVLPLPQIRMADSCRFARRALRENIEHGEHHCCLALPADDCYCCSTPGCDASASALP
jgi:hypothetical protein